MEVENATSAIAFFTKQSISHTLFHDVIHFVTVCIWSSKKQRGVTTLTTEAEYVALSEAAKMIVWTTRWLEELMPEHVMMLSLHSLLTIRLSLL